jgi:hypothetical protein
MTVHPDAQQRICEEIDRTVWPIDRKFFRDNPKRSYWLRPAQQVEISEKEIIRGRHIPVAPGALALIAVRQVVPGVRMRTLIVIEDPPPGPCPAIYPSTFVAIGTTPTPILNVRR